MQNSPEARSLPREALAALGKATTVYYEATPDRMEKAREEYEEALRNFNAIRDASKG
jgi:hypothetical protein